MGNDDYYRLRVETELVAAAAATDTGVAQIHREMAERYRQLMAVERVGLNGDAGSEFAEPRPLSA